MSDKPYVAPDRIMAKQILAEKIARATQKPEPVKAAPPVRKPKPVPASTAPHVPERLVAATRPMPVVSFGIPELTPERKELLQRCKDGVAGAESRLQDYDKRTAANERTS